VGCGNGSFCFALAELGARYIEGIDFGENSIRYAEQLRRWLQLSEKIHFTLGNVYALPYKMDSFDTVIQNGVFHHLANENHAIREIGRVIKPGGLLWYYTEGEGALHNEIFEMSSVLLKDVPIDFVKRVLLELHLSPNKIHYLMDRLNATYRKTTWNEITERLASFGFGDFRGFKGGFKWEYDQEIIESDPYGREKFGEGIIRVLAEYKTASIL
jgi:ubiquinone/menaquinone biosynthesis C-methylase UbiE